MTALAVRLAVSSQLLTVAFVRTPKLDSFEYLEWAKTILAGTGAWPVVPAHAPGYPYFLAGVLAVVGDSLRAVYVMQSVLGGLSSLLVAALAWRLSGSRPAIVAGLVHACYGPAVLADTTLFAEGLLICLLLIALVALTCVRTIWFKALLGGALLGLAALVRPTSLVLIPVLLLRVATESRRLRIGLALAGLATFACVATVSPVLYKNLRTSGSAIIQAYFGLNFYLGNTPSGSGTAWARFGSGWDRVEGEALRAEYAKPSDQDAYYLRKVAREIQARPFAYLALLASKTVWVIQAEEIRDSHSFWFYRSQSPLLACLLTFGFVIPFAVMGLGVSFARCPLNRDHLTLVGYLVALAATCVLVVVGFRYRLPMTPVLNVYAAAGIVALWDAARHRDHRVIVLLVSLGLAAVAVSHVRRHLPSHDFAEEWAFVGSALNTERDLPAAERAYREAITLDPANAYAWDGLGLVLLNAGRQADARIAVEKALAIDRDDSRAHYHLALVARQQGDLDAAIAEMQRSLALVPDRDQVMRSLVGALFQAGRFNEAVPVVRRLAVMNPRDSTAHLALARALILTEGPAAALRELALARQLAPDSDQLAVTEIVLQLLARDLLSAAAAVDRYAVATSHSPQAQILTALLARLQGREDEARRTLVNVARQAPPLRQAVDFLLAPVTEDEHLATTDEFLRRVLAEPPW